MKAIKSLLLLFVSTIAQVNIHAQDVRPGDFNMDGTVNVADALYWGLAHGKTGPVRTNATTDWTEQAADDWTESIQLVNNKYQDGNGNGIIDTLDLQALYANYDSIHIDTIKGMVSSDNDFWIDYFYKTNAAGIKVHRYSIRLKSPGEFHGIAFTFDYSGFGNAAMDVSIDTTGLWFGSDDVLVEVLQATDYQLHVAATSTNQNNIQIGVDDIVNIVVCEPIAALTNFPEVNVINGEMIQADETRQRIESLEYTTPSPEPECLVLWDGERCEYENGMINHKEARHNEGGKGICFEGRLYGNDVASISIGCDNLYDVYDICTPDSLWFYAKTDVDGIGQAIEFYITDTLENAGNAITINALNTAYQRIAIPINALMNKDCPLEGIGKMSFRKANNANDFLIYVEDVHAQHEWAHIWTSDDCYYYDGTLNEEEAYSGRYCYERIIDEEDNWYHTAISLWCEEKTPYDLTRSDEIRFYAKADKQGRTFNFNISERDIEWEDCRKELNINNYIEDGVLSTHYKLVRVPIDSLKTDECTLENIDGLHFYNRDDLDFKFYIDDIHVYSNIDSCMVVSTTTPPETPNPILTLYPNPVSTSILNIDIHYPQSTPAEMFIIDLQGQILYQSHTMLMAGNNKLSYATDQLPVGMYVAQIRDHNGYITARKFVMMK